MRPATIPSPDGQVCGGDASNDRGHRIDPIRRRAGLHPGWVRESLSVSTAYTIASHPRCERVLVTRLMGSDPRDGCDVEGCLRESLIMIARYLCVRFGESMRIFITFSIIHCYLARPRARAEMYVAALVGIPQECGM